MFLWCMCQSALCRLTLRSDRYLLKNLLHTNFKIICSSLFVYLLLLIAFLWLTTDAPEGLRALILDLALCNTEKSTKERVQFNTKKTTIDKEDIYFCQLKDHACLPSLEIALLVHWSLSNTSVWSNTSKHISCSPEDGPWPRAAQSWPKC